MLMRYENQLLKLKDLQDLLVLMQCAGEDGAQYLAIAPMIFVKPCQMLQNVFVPHMSIQSSSLPTQLADSFLWTRTPVSDPLGLEKLSEELLGRLS